MPDIGDLVVNLNKRYLEDLEEMCERSLTDPLGRGVLVIRNDTGWTMSLDAEVPWATIHEYPNGRDGR